MSVTPSEVAVPPYARLVVVAEIRTSLTSQSWSLDKGPRTNGCLVFVLDRGEGVVRLSNDQEIQLNAPSLIWLPPRSASNLQIAAGSHGVEMAFAQELVWRTVKNTAISKDLLNFAGKVALIEGKHLTDIEPDLQMIIQSVDQEASSSSPGGSAIIEFSLGLLLIRLWRAVSEGDREGHTSTGGSIIQRFRHLINLHFREDLTVVQYANLLGVTRDRLQDACAKVANTTPIAMIHARILEEAQHCLTQTDMSIERIAFSLGFRDAPYFNRFFKRTMGMSPGAFRKAAEHASAMTQRATFSSWP